MAKYKQQTYEQMVMLPVSLEDQIVPGTMEFAIHTLVEDRMDLSRFDEKYQNDEAGIRIQDGLLGREASQKYRYAKEMFNLWGSGENQQYS